LLLLTGFGLYAQTFVEEKISEKEKTAIMSDWNDYSDAMQRKDWNAVIEKIYPGLFRLSSKEDILRAMENGLNNLDYKTEILPVDNVYVFPRLLKKNKEKYALISYTDKLSIIFNKKSTENDPTFNGRMDYMYHKLKKKYPAGQLMRGSEKNIFHLRIPKYMLAVYIPEKQSYTFIDFSTNPQKLAMLEQILDRDIIDYFSNKIKTAKK
jgi:hypothetical protein